MGYIRGERILPGDCAKNSPSKRNEDGVVRFDGRFEGDRDDVGDPARFKDDDRSSERERLVDVVGHENERLAGLRVKGPDIAPELPAREVVQSPEGLVHEDDFRIEHQRSSERDALGHSSGQVLRICVAEAFESEHSQRLRCFAFDLFAVASAFERETDILCDRQPRHEARLLEDDADSGVVSFDAASVAEEFDRAFRGFFEPRHEAQERRFAATAPADDRHERSGIDGQREPVYGANGAVRQRVCPADAAQPNPNRHGGLTPPSTARPLARAGRTDGPTCRRSGRAQGCRRR